MKEKQTKFIRLSDPELLEGINKVAKHQHTTPTSWARQKLYAAMYAEAVELKIELGEG